MRILTVSDVRHRFGVRREDIVAVAEGYEIGRKVGSTFVFTPDDVEDLEDALVEEGLLDEDPDDAEDDDPGGPGDEEDGETEPGDGEE